MVVQTLEADTTGGLVVSTGGGAGLLVQRAGQLQYGELLLGSGTSARWIELVGWRDLPEAQTGDSERPQAHGTYPGQVIGDAAVVTFTFWLRGSPEDKLRALATLELHTRMDGVERMLTVDDGDGPWFRMGRVIGRNVPQGVHFRHAPLQCSVQWLCADPRRYRLGEKSVTVTRPTSSGGLVYPLTYPLDYGTSSSGAAEATNDGSVKSPPVITFYGPLTNPVLSAGGWRLGFGIVLADGETLVVDTNEGTALLNGTADRLYTIRPDSDPIERCLLAPGDTDLSLVATSGTGRVTATYHDARM